MAGSEVTESADRLWDVFKRWCAARGLPALPAAQTTIERWLTDESRSVSTIRVYTWAIQQAHKNAGLPDPMAGYDKPGLLGRRARAQIQRLPVLTQMLKALPVHGRDLDVRGRALLLMAYGGGLSLDELRHAHWSRLSFRPDGLVLTVEDEVVVIGRGAHASTDPIRAVTNWMLLTGAGYMFPGYTTAPNPMPLKLRTLRRVIRQLGGVGLNQALSRGLADDALRAGLPDDVVQRHLGRDSDVDRRLADRLVQAVGL